MSDEELIARFESVTLPPGDFTHAAHVRVAWWYLMQAPLPEALARFCAALRRFATAHGAAGKYHETITVAWMLILAERIEGTSADSWETFAAANPDLLARHPPVLSRYYEPATLVSDRARRVFVMPDRLRD